MGLTKTPCAEHVRRLERSGVIRGSRAELAPEAMGVDHIVMVQVLLNSATALDLRLVNEAVRRIPEIESCHMIAGDFDYLPKVRTKDIKEYRRIMAGGVERGLRPLRRVVQCRYRGPGGLSQRSDDQHAAGAVRLSCASGDTPVLGPHEASRAS